MKEHSPTPWLVELTTGIGGPVTILRTVDGREVMAMYGAPMDVEHTIDAVNSIDRITAERDALRKALETGTNKLGRVTAWLERLAIAAEKQAKDIRFQSLADAYAADAKNYRKTMEDLIPVVNDARRLLDTLRVSDAGRD